ncbi:peptide-methionine (S)-S-oxide reductase [Candidatus Gracilibacteria bacterium CG17_big_fil_post_rev_8_21_14_2_50_48_13]|nr:MAG: peptide-methionine (S)-S-oxide reductase [Candidatus Gracilibacteria bacterium CG17_big_fil_post_rev_8_21_14_2_50_48_13]
MNTSNQPPLTEEEARVIEGKGTEAPFSGKYDDFFQQGTYLCRRCGSPLYRSKDKFRSGCGWPSFDDALPGRVQETLDADGRRTEITCKHCGAHLGHVFRGEALTEKNTRHCVNSVSMTFVPEIIEEVALERATLGGGCFWCIEATLRMLRGVTDVISGYTGGHVDHPTYEQVSRGTTGHVEVAQIVFDPEHISFAELLLVFFTLHDPTTLNLQGNDIGEQYASAIFYHSEEQKATALEVIEKLTKEQVWDDPIVTRVEPLGTFWKAEDYHQKYMEKNPDQGYCRAVIAPKVAKMRALWSHFLS